MVIHIQIHRELLDILLSVHTQFVFSTLLILDVNNDGFLDEQELEALFTKEVKKKKVQELYLFQKTLARMSVFSPSTYRAVGLRIRILRLKCMNPTCFYTTVKTYEQGK